MNRSLIQKLLTAVSVYNNWYMVLIDRLTSKGEITYRTRLGPKVICRCGDSDSGECAVIFSGKEYPVELLDLNSLPDGSCIVDLGANVGAFAIWISFLIYSRGRNLTRLCCVEPDLDNLKILKKNLLLNGLDSVEIYEGVIGESVGVTQIAKKGKSDGIKVVKEGGVRVNQTTLCKLAEEFDFKRIDILKVDIEGSEYAVLEGAYDFVLNHVEKMIVEVHGAPNSSENSLWRLYEPAFEVKRVSNNILFFKNRRACVS